MDPLAARALRLPLPPGAMPPLARAPMRARPWAGFARGLAAGLRAGFGRPAQPSRAAAPWQRAAARRRAWLAGGVLLATALATGLLAHAQGAAPITLLQGLQVALFALLFAWVTAGCLTAVVGLLVLWRGDRHALALPASDAAAPDATARTAIVMPVCNEDVASFAAGLRATCASLAETGALDRFDVYLLSDSSDPALRAAEVAAYAALRGEIESAGGHLYYRWRRLRTRRKAGNVADFCRRWGRRYRYMVVLDADSVMSGEALLTLVRLMEAHPQVGILQTAPQPCGHASVHARAQSFAARVTGRLFTAGMQYWQLGEAHYWGHNAIIRVAPFMAHCALAPLPGRGALSGDILSHDFVEAALMRRAGYQVWLLPELAGSYEQPPPHLLAELQRDRRWCQGNLQNARLLAEPGLHPAHRVMLAAGAMAYASAPLWLAYVALGIALWWAGGNAFVATDGDLARGVPVLWAATLTMLALPRALGVLLVLRRGEQAGFGGSAALLRSALCEAGLSVLQAPLRMVAHSLFVLGALTGWKLHWTSPPRQALAVGWAEAGRRFAPAAAAGLALVATLGARHAPVLPWLLPVLLPLWLAAPLAVLTSRADPAARPRRQDLLRIPEEARVPPVLAHAWDTATGLHATPRPPALHLVPSAARMP